MNVRGPEMAPDTPKGSARPGGPGARVEFAWRL